MDSSIKTEFGPEPMEALRRLTGTNSMTKKNSTQEDRKEAAAPFYAACNEIEPEQLWLIVRKMAKQYKVAITYQEEELIHA